VSTTVALLISVLLLACNGFFVAAEFALVAAKRHRLEAAAASGSLSARAAIAGVSELSLMLAGAQLGITLCTLGLGSLTEPAVAHLLHPVFELVGLPENAGHVIALVIAVGGIGLLHILLGEMAPKSWAISDPERSALLLALPFRAFTWVFRPLLIVLNWLANVCVRALNVTPRNEIANAHGPEELRLLI
jgi:CBS domain containing-hemolysin-like protein